MTKPEVKPSYKCLSDYYTLDRLSIRYAGSDMYLIRAIISGEWVLCANVSRSVYDQYRMMFYTDTAGAKNFLLDQLTWDGYPFARSCFRFVNVVRPLSDEALNELRRFVSTLK
ncbi:hypothetical protein PN586_07070 [Parabacteroides merdae]|uniref:Uncharacterized protein n=1 Tax=Parabacteroides hominis TaxID=2763057 RepID=A0ABR7DQ96_9BACT|nr:MULTISPECIES: hypothetical protein [Parabacteroides]DAN65444.1 MAG TPA: hypothetical protein [Caudoviricetes sp.]MBC5633601.1 hypothetical protein [Parabacteroides hominis]MDB8880680.1 hypothetical protein [Parabacteroides merdae]MDB8891566.1 hypothetical protein [Parabacteroides merdae]MDB8895133.1 hypothetical protein [Parabacteroides merdae]